MLLRLHSGAAEEEGQEWQLGFVVVFVLWGKTKGDLSQGFGDGKVKFQRASVYLYLHRCNFILVFFMRCRSVLGQGTRVARRVCVVCVLICGCRAYSGTKTMASFVLQGFCSAGGGILLACFAQQTATFVLFRGDGGGAGGGGERFLFSWVDSVYR